MSVGGIIQKKVENLTETVEKKLEEYQEDLERYLIIFTRLYFSLYF